MESLQIQLSDSKKKVDQLKSELSVSKQRIDQLESQRIKLQEDNRTLDAQSVSVKVGEILNLSHRIEGNFGGRANVGKFGKCT